ncbi:MAG: Crp/Fnr family transcriptional regulator [Chloroflexi bacterium]|nr:Crp/Fnr family transcriptional regulator [Chloroflexota bacterium]
MSVLAPAPLPALTPRSSAWPQWESAAVAPPAWAAPRSDAARLVGALSRLPPFAALDRSQLWTLVRAAERRVFARNQIVWRQGEQQLDAVGAIYLILHGQVRLTVASRTGREVVLSVLDPGDSFGELTNGDRDRHSRTVMATCPTVVLGMREDALIELCRHSPDVALALLKLLAKRFRDAMKLVEDRAFFFVRARLARQLLSLAAAHGQAGPRGIRMGRRLTQRELASAIGASRESVNKQLARFRRRGILTSDRSHLVILRPDALEALGSP